MDSVGLRELRQQASEIVRRVEAGERIVVTVSGRPVAQISPAGRGSWRRFADVADVFAGPADPAWREDMARVDADLRDPWAAA